MIQRNNNLSVLPFYQNIEEQNHRRSYAYGDIYPLYTQVGKIPPFQIVVPHETYSLSKVSLYRADGSLVTDNILSQMYSGEQIKEFAYFGYDVMVYTGSPTISSLSEEGQYYLTVVFSNGTYYSDVFTAVGSVAPYVKVEWYDLEDLEMDGCRIVYDLGNGNYFKNYVYLNTEIGKPDYVFEDEGETRDGLFFPEKMISEKTYKMTFLASEPMCDVMRFVRLSDRMKVTDRYGREYQCDTFLITPKWETQGNIASVECEFQTNTVAKRIGRAITL